jgi:serine phosphatase RsbU (regulator of sigma subunit)
MPRVRVVNARTAWSRAWWIVLAVPFAISAGSFIARETLGAGWGLLPLLVVGPAAAAAVGGARYTLAAGVTAAAGCLLYDAEFWDNAVSRRPVLIALLATAGVTAFGMLAARIREQRTQELARVRLVAEVAQRVLLRPQPARAGPVTMAVRYLSAAREAQVGGDLYEVVVRPDRVRLIVGDAQGSGLVALRPAAAVTAVFREAARDEDCLNAVVARLEASTAIDEAGEDFVTAVLAEISGDGAKMEIINCGHPPPLLFGTGPPRFIVPDESGLPLGLVGLGGAPREPVTIPLEPGQEVLFYTDGASEARNPAGEFFPLAGCRSVAVPGDPATLVAQLTDEITRHVGHQPDDDVALLLVRREAFLTRSSRSGPPRSLRRWSSSPRGSADQSRHCLRRRPRRHSRLAAGLPAGGRGSTRGCRHSPAAPGPGWPGGCCSWRSGWPWITPSPLTRFWPGPGPPRWGRSWPRRQPARPGSGSGCAPGGWRRP